MILLDNDSIIRYSNTMLMRIGESDGTETLLFEGSDNIAVEMIKFFRREIGLYAVMVVDADWECAKEQFQSIDNQKRGIRYRAEYVKFGMTLLKVIK